MSESAAKEPIVLDGRTLEGGGQLLRLALSLSSLTGIPVEITDIRGRRSGGGGLKAQHLACVNWLAHACNATVTGAEKGSKSLSFKPADTFGTLSPAFTKRRSAENTTVFECVVDIATAGSTGLALQAVLPYILFAPPSITNGDTDATINQPVRLTVNGGTNVSGSPSFEYIKQVLLPTLERIGFPAINATLTKRGWSHGNSSIGSFILDIPARSNVTLPAFQLRSVDTSAKPSKPSILKATFIGPPSIHEHFKEVFTPTVQHYFGNSYSIDKGNLEMTCEDGRNSKGLYFILVATVPAPAGSTIEEYRLGRDWLYERKIRSFERSATEMAERVALDLYHEWQSGAWADEHMRDQLVVFEALAKGRSVVFGGNEKDGEEREPSLHARTAEWVARQILGVTFDSSGVCEGMAYGTSTEGLQAMLNDLLLD